MNIVILALIAAGALSEADTRQSIDLLVDTVDGQCLTKVNGKSFKESEKAIAAVRRSNLKRAHVRMTKRTTYRCVGGIIFNLQRLGYATTFSAEPPSP